MENQGQNKEDNGILCADFDARLADVLDGVMSGAELEAFKRDIDVRLFATSLGYEIDKRDSWRGSTVMRRRGDARPTATDSGMNDRVRPRGL